MRASVIPGNHGNIYDIIGVDVLIICWCLCHLSIIMISITIN